MRSVPATKPPGVEGVIGSARTDTGTGDDSSPRTAPEMRECDPIKRFLPTCLPTCSKKFIFSMILRETYPNY